MAEETTTSVHFPLATIDPFTGQDTPAAYDDGASGGSSGGMVLSQGAVIAIIVVVVVVALFGSTFPTPTPCPSQSLSSFHGFRQS